MPINIVLLEPEIPQNTGNIVRTCAAIGANLHLIRPLGFLVDDKSLKRAGLDYWNEVNIQYYDSFIELKEKYKDGSFYYATTKALNSYSDVNYNMDCFIVFGKESAGLPEGLLKDNKELCIRIPMRENIRSLNLSNSVAIVAFEVLRQNDFTGLEDKGKLAKLQW